MKLKPFIFMLFIAYTNLGIAQNDIVLSAYDPGVTIQNKTTEVNPQTATNTTSQLFHHAGDPFLGNPKGDISLVEFFDYQCSHCRHMTIVLKKLVNDNSELRVVFKEFPIRGATSLYAAKACLAAKLQGKYNQLHEALMNRDDNLNEEIILNLAKSVGIDIVKLKTDMLSKLVDQQIDENQQLARKLGLMSTPAFYLGMTYKPSKITYINGAVDTQYLQDAINKLVQQA